MATMTESELEGVLEKVSNWGRWGKEDQRGALNFITGQKRAAAARMVQSGQTVSLSQPLATEPAIDNPTPVVHLMRQTGHDFPGALPHSADFFTIAPHGHANTHLDAFCHIFYRGKMYNGFDAIEVGSHGAKRCAIDAGRDGIVGRGVLLDLPRLKGVQWLENGEAILPADLEAAEREHQVRVEEGDILLIRVGRWDRRRAKGAWSMYQDGVAGLEAGCLEWLHQRRIAVLGCDGISDVRPTGYKILPIHVGALVMMGVHLIDNANLDGLAQTCKRTGQYHFMFMMAPLVLERGTASPVNPIAVF